MEREKRLIIEAPPCDTNYFDKTLLTVEQAIERGREYCANRNTCKERQIYCALKYGQEMAKHVVKGSTLEEELREFSIVTFLNEKFWNSVNGKEYTIIQGKGKVLRAVEGFARIVLLMDPFQSVLPSCKKCNGAMLTTTVFDSIHDGPFPLSGSGKTRKRVVTYCPDCDSEPKGGFITGDEAEENIFS